ncbi:sigma factor-like helix-turn-helix DNA-binding protein [Rhizobium bangladeshense]|uniref:sigma factor-like helix-turn-helix DNA-binding protein n=1 Tax=Rhizobium bangladeshense TaxID=1138189 RepID=UPI000B1B549C
MQNFADAVYDHLPVLRRFARGHTITIQAADDLLLQALERLRSRWILVDKDAIRLEMFRQIHGLASEANNPVESHNPTSQGGTDIAWHIRRLSPFDRSLLLLTSVEGLSHEDTAWILRTSESQIVPRLVQARDRLRESVGSRSRQHLTTGGNLRRVK